MALRRPGQGHALAEWLATTLPVSLSRVSFTTCLGTVSLPSLPSLARAPSVACCPAGSSCGLRVPVVGVQGAPRLPLLRRACQHTSSGCHAPPGHSKHAPLGSVYVPGFPWSHAFRARVRVPLLSIARAHASRAGAAPALPPRCVPCSLGPPPTAPFKGKAGSSAKTAVGFPLRPRRRLAVPRRVASRRVASPPYPAPASFIARAAKGLPRPDPSALL